MALRHLVQRGTGHLIVIARIITVINASSQPQTVYWRQALTFLVLRRLKENGSSLTIVLGYKIQWTR